MDIWGKIEKSKFSFFRVVIFLKKMFFQDLILQALGKNFVSQF